MSASILDKSDFEIREWWRGLTEDQRGEVSFYADALVWGCIERACATAFDTRKTIGDVEGGEG